MIKTLDFVRPKGVVVRRWDEKFLAISEEVATNNIGLVTEVTPSTDTMPAMASIQWLDNSLENRKGLFNAWWFEKDLIIINNLAHLLTNQMAHPFGNNKHTGDIFYPIKID